MDNQDSKFLKEAIALAQKNAASAEGGPFGAVIVFDGKIIASASNTVTVDFDPTAHAEVNAIRAAARILGNFNLTGCVLYTSCEPCPMCLSAAYWAHVDRIVYAANRGDAANAGFDDDFIYRELALPIEGRSLKIERLLPREGLVPFTLWMENDKKVEY